MDGTLIRKVMNHGNIAIKSFVAESVWLLLPSSKDGHAATQTRPL